MAVVSPCVVRFVVRRFHGDEPENIPIQQLSGANLAEHWTGEDPCCDMLGGFLLEIDGKPWNADGIDELWMARSWIEAIRELLLGAAMAKAQPWEESNLRLIRRGDTVELFDVHHAGSVVFPSITVSLVTLAEGIGRAAVAAWDRFTAMGADSPRDLLDHLGLGWVEEGRSLADAAMWVEPVRRGQALPSLAWLALQLDDTAAFEAAIRSLPSAAELVWEDESLLMTAIQLGRRSAVRTLLEVGVDVERPSNGQGPLAVAVARNDEELVEALLAAGASVEPAEGMRPLWAACWASMYNGQDTMITERLMEEGAAVTLDCAVVLGDRETAEALVDQARDFPDIMRWAIQRIRRERYLPSGLSAADRRASWLQLLQRMVAAGANAQPALMEAILSEDVGLADLAIAAGADPELPVDDAPNAAVYADRQYHPGMKKRFPLR